MSEYDMRVQKMDVNLEDKIQLLIRYAEVGKPSDFDTIFHEFLSMPDELSDNETKGAQSARVFALVRFALGMKDPFNRYR